MNYTDINIEHLCMHETCWHYKTVTLVYTCVTACSSQSMGLKICTHLYPFSQWYLWMIDVCMIFVCLLNERGSDWELSSVCQILCCLWRISYSRSYGQSLLVSVAARLGVGQGYSCVCIYVKVFVIFTFCWAWFYDLIFFKPCVSNLTYFVAVSIVSYVKIFIRGNAHLRISYIKYSFCVIIIWHFLCH